MKSWKTTVCGLVAAGCAAIAQAPGLDPQWAHMIATVGSAVGGLGLMFARDANKTSEDHGLAPGKTRS